MPLKFEFCTFWSDGTIRIRLFLAQPARIWQGLPLIVFRWTDAVEKIERHPTLQNFANTFPLKRIVLQQMRNTLFFSWNRFDPWTRNTDIVWKIMKRPVYHVIFCPWFLAKRIVFFYFCAYNSETDSLVHALNDNCQVYCTVSTLLSSKGEERKAKLHRSWFH